MEQSDIRSTISNFCLTFSGLPVDVKPEILLDNVIIKGAINAQLIYTASGDAKWLIRFDSQNVVEDNLKTPHISLRLDDETHEVEIEQSVPCDIPAEWLGQELPSHVQQSGRGQGHVPSENYQHQTDNFQYGHQGGMPQFPPRHMYFPNPYGGPQHPQFQYPYVPVPGQGQYQNAQQTQHTSQAGFVPQPPPQGPTYPHYNYMYGNQWGQYPQFSGQRMPPPPRYGNYEQQQSGQHNPQHMTAASTHDMSGKDRPEHNQEATWPHQQHHMPMPKPEHAQKENPQHHMPMPSPEHIQKENTKQHTPVPRPEHIQEERQQHPMPSAPWEVSEDHKSEALHPDYNQIHRGNQWQEAEYYQEHTDNYRDSFSPSAEETKPKAVYRETCEDRRSIESGPKKTAMIKVSKLPKNTTLDSLTLFFESRRKTGGGPIEDVDFEESDFTAIITFKDSDAVDRVLQKLPILFQSKQIEVEAFYPGGEKSEDELSDTNEDDQSFVCTIEVHGVKPATSDDTIEFYFENTRRSGGGDINNIKREEEVVYITFEDEKVVQRVLAQRKHMIDGVELEVKQYISPPPPKPRPMYENKVFISGMNPDTTEDCLSNFLEAKTSILPSEIRYGEEEGTALVTFEEQPDIEKLISACKKRALEKCYLIISKVPVTNCIIVSGFGENTSKDTLEFYFENKKRSGGGDIEKIEMNEDGNTCLVYFSDISVLENVCKKIHSIDGQKLQVKIYHECLGQVDVEEEQEVSAGPSIPARGPKFKVPDPVIVTDINSRKLEFLQKTESVRKGVDKEMSNCHAEIEWPNTKNEPLKLMCTLSPDVKDYRKLSKSWKKSATEKLNGFVNALHIEKFDILQEAWDLVQDGLKSLSVKHPEGVTIFVEKSSAEIFVVGYRNIIQDVSKQIQEIINRVTEELDRKKKQMKETVTTAKQHQIRILHVSHFPQKMSAKFQGLKVNINLKKSEITFEGLMGDITQAKLEMYQFFQTIVSSKAGNFSVEKLNFLESAKVKEYISKNLRKDGLCAVWDIDTQQNLIVYSLSDDEAVKGAHNLKDAIVETPIALKEEALCLLQSQKWLMTKDEIENIAPGLISIIPEPDKKQVLIYTVSKYGGAAREKMDDFLQENTIYEKQMECPPGKMRFLQQRHKDNISKIAKQLEEHQVTITVDNIGIRIKGTSLGLHQAMKRVDDIVDNIEQKIHIVKKPGMAKYLLSDAGQENIKRVEKTKQCVIESSVCSPSTSEEEFEIIEKPDKSQYQDLATCVTNGGQRIIVRKGDITELDVDVLVNAANKDLRHDGGLARVVVQKGGDSIQDECADFIRKRGRLYEGDVCCSQSGNLKCKLIVHAVGPIWQGGGNQEEELLREVVFKSLEESEQQGYKSVAFPALCSGIFGYPVNQATKVIAESIREFFEDNQGKTCVKDVFLCDIKDDNVELFVKGLRKAFGKDNVQEQNRGKSNTTWTTPSYRRGKSSDTSSRRRPCKFCKINIKIVKGQIARQKVDVIVNTTSSDLKLANGAVSASILKTGGQILQDECFNNYPNGIQHGEVAVTSGGNLQCKRVLHGSLPNWDGRAALDVMTAFMNSCLTEVSKNGFSSVAFPALGTGKLNFPKDVVAKDMYQCVIDFSSKNPSSSITEVMFVLYDKDIQTVQAFEDDEIRRETDADTDEGTSRSSRKGRQFSTDAVTPKQGGNRGGGHAQPHKQKPRGHHQGGHGGGQGTLVTIGKLKLKVYQGDITKARADVIVNSTNSEFDLTRGAVAQAILTKGGKDLEKQIQLNKQKMKDKGVVVTTSGKGMPCDYIIHINAEDKRKGWKSKIIKILDKSEKLQKTSVAFPALGTGLGAKIEDVADDLFDAMVEFQNSSFQSLEEVHMVIFQVQMMESFISQIKSCVNTKGKKSKGIFAAITGFFGFSSDDRSSSKETERMSNRGEDNYAEDETHPKSLEPSSLKLTIYANNRLLLDEAVDMIEKDCEKTFQTKLFEERIIKEFSKAQENAILGLAEEYGVEVKLEKRIGRLRITGCVEDLMHASDDVFDIIRQAERRRQALQEAKLYADLVKWNFIEITQDGNQLVEYPDEINRLLEKAYKNQDADVKFSDNNGIEYTVDLNKLVEYPTDDPRDRVTVIRKDLVRDTTFEPPANWANMQDNENITVIDLNPQSSEYQTVISNFYQTSGQTFNIVKCERIQNRALYQQYVAKKKSMDAQNPSTVVNEKMLWHGTAGGAVDSINAYGFNRSYCGKNAVVHGNGVYFAVSASYSCRTTYSPPDPATGYRHIYQCKVLTGEYAQGQQGMRVPPNKPSASGAASHILYDSVVDNPQNPGIFVIFNDTQAYPEYRIIFA